MEPQLWREQRRGRARRYTRTAIEMRMMIEVPGEEEGVVGRHTGRYFFCIFFVLLISANLVTSLPHYCRGHSNACKSNVR